MLQQLKVVKVRLENDMFHLNLIIRESRRTFLRVRNAHYFRIVMSEKGKSTFMRASVPRNTGGGKIVK